MKRVNKLTSSAKITQTGEETAKHFDNLNDLFIHPAEPLLQPISGCNTPRR